MRAASACARIWKCSGITSGASLERKINFGSWQSLEHIIPRYIFDRLTIQSSLTWAINLTKSSDVTCPYDPPGFTVRPGLLLDLEHDRLLARLVERRIVVFAPIFFAGICDLWQLSRVCRIQPLCLFFVLFHLVRSDLLPLSGNEFADLDKTVIRILNLRRK